MARSSFKRKDLVDIPETIMGCCLGFTLHLRFVFPPHLFFPWHVPTRTRTWPWTCVFGACVRVNSSIKTGNMRSISPWWFCLGFFTGWDAQRHGLSGFRKNRWKLLESAKSNKKHFSVEKRLRKIKTKRKEIFQQFSFNNLSVKI